MKRPRAIVENASGAIGPLYNRAAQRAAERRLRRGAKKARRSFWRFPPSAS